MSALGVDLLALREKRMRSRDLGDDRRDCYSCGGGVRVAAMAERLRIILGTSTVAYEIESPDGGFMVAWRYEHDGDSPTPLERVRQIKARRQAVQS